MSSESDTMINCVNIRCTFLGLPGSSSVQVDVNARLDERFFSVSIHAHIQGCTLHSYMCMCDKQLLLVGDYESSI